MSLAIGQWLDRYEVVASLATGGMAELYLVRSVGLERFEKLAVLKRVLPQHARDQAFVKMLLDEARLAATLRHPNVVQVFDVGATGGMYYFTMEYVPGENLGTIMATAAQAKLGLRTDVALAVVVAAAAGLHHAHQQRGPDGRPLHIVHRDVSPSNILVSYDGHVKVVDFGIAKASERAVETTGGLLKGKLRYMSPEQVQAAPDLDHRTDQFSLATVLYELTTGRRAWSGSGDYAIAQKIVAGDITPPSMVRSSYPPALERVVMRALSVDREARFPSCRELQAALEEVARELKYSLSTLAVSDFMGRLFPDKDAARLGQIQRPMRVTAALTALAEETSTASGRPLLAESLPIPEPATPTPGGDRGGIEPFEPAPVPTASPGSAAGAVVTEPAATTEAVPAAASEAVPTPALAPPRGSRWRWPLAAVAVAAAVAALAIARPWRRADRARPASPPTATTTSPPPTTAAPPVAPPAIEPAPPAPPATSPPPPVATTAPPAAPPPTTDRRTPGRGSSRGSAGRPPPPEVAPPRDEPPRDPPPNLDDTINPYRP